jgi:hypothetical protein
MNPSTKVGVAVAGGYLLGRTKRARLAIALGSYLLGVKLDPKALGKEALQQLSQRPEFAKLTGDMRGEMLNVGRAAALAAMNSRIERFATSLDSRTSQLRDQLELGSGSSDGETEDGVEDDYDDFTDEADDEVADDEGAEDEGAEDEGAEDEGVEDDDTEQPRRESRRRSSERPQRRSEHDQARSDRPERRAAQGGDRAQRPSKASRSGGGSRSTGRKSAAPAKRPARKADARRKAASSSSRRSG